MKQFALFILAHVIFLIGIYYAGAVGETIRPMGEYYSDKWADVINRPYVIDDYYPRKLKINPKTLRRTIDEYFSNESIIRESLLGGVDCYEQLETADDKYLDKYKMDLKYDPADSKLKLYWKNNF